MNSNENWKEEGMLDYNSWVLQKANILSLPCACVV